MSEEVTLGLDLGTSGVKVVALTRSGEVIAEANRSYPLHTPRPGWTQQEPADWVRGSLEALAEVRDGLDVPVLALGLSGQMHGLVPLDRAGEVIRPAMLWNDGRTGPQVEHLERVVSRRDLVARTGNRAVAGFQLPKILWLRDEEPESFARLRSCLLPKDYLGFVLTGEMRTEPSDASGVGALNLARRTWDDDILSALDLSASLFPEVVESHAVVGTWRGMPVVAGGGDNAAAGVALGLSSARPEIGSLSLGTSGVIFAPLTKPTPDPEGRVHLFAHADGGYHLLGVTLSAAGALQWMKAKIAPEAEIGTLLREAAEVSDAGGVTFLPFLSGERSPWMNPDLRGAWSGLSLASSRGHLTRALLEGVAMSLADAFDVMRPLSHVESLLATGGGARSDLWLGLVSGASEREVLRPQREPGAAHGAALLAWKALGSPLPGPPDSKVVPPRELDAARYRALTAGMRTSPRP